MSPLFEYEAIDDFGKKVVGKEEARDNNELSAILSGKGLYILKAISIAVGKTGLASAGDLLLRPSWWAVAGWLMLGGLFLLMAIAAFFLLFGHALWPSIVLFVFGSLSFIAATWQRYCRKYYISANGLCAEVGIITRKYSEINLKDVRNIRIYQGIDGKLFNFGTLVFETAGTWQGEVIFWGVKDPLELKSDIQRLRAP